MALSRRRRRGRRRGRRGWGGQEIRSGDNTSGLTPPGSPPLGLFLLLDLLLPPFPTASTTIRGPAHCWAGKRERRGMERGRRRAKRTPSLYVLLPSLLIVLLSLSHIRFTFVPIHGRRRRKGGGGGAKRGRACVIVRYSSGVRSG